MVWTAPRTAGAGAVFSAAQFNLYVRDIFNQTAVAQATVPGSLFAGYGANQVAQRTPASALMAAGATTTSTSYGDLSDGPGPSVTVQTGTVAMVWIFCNQNNSSGNAAWMTIEASGDSTVTAADGNAVQMQGNDGDRNGAGILFDTLAAGTTTFTARYRVSTSGTGYFSQRRIVVWPF